MQAIDVRPSATPEHPRLSLTGKEWIWPEPLPRHLDTLPGVPSWLCGILNRRGIVGPRALEDFLAPSLQALADPLGLADMQAAVDCLEQAIAEQRAVAVFGDYDVDGVCATVILVEFLSQIGATASYYIPDRRSEGYGLNSKAIEQLAAQHGVLVAVDCGITADSEVAFARELGLDVIVVDHHRVGSSLPPASAAVDPQRADCRYPCKELCAAGLVFLLVGALRRQLREHGFFADRAEPDVRAQLDLTALATVADMVPIRDANRILVAAGLRRLASAHRVGLQALMEVSRVDPATVTATDLAFRLGPRINARGRLGHARDAVELLLTTNRASAKKLANELEAANLARRELEQATLEAAIEQIETQSLDARAALVLSDPAWHPGILGIVATRLVGRYNRPAVVIGQGGRGSGRSIAELDLHASLLAVSDHLARFGGHRAAAGVTIGSEQLSAFEVAFVAEVQRVLGDPPYVAKLRPELEVDVASLDLRMAYDMERLAPFGQKNPEPLLVAANVPVRAKRVVGKNHLKLRLGEAGHDAIGFDLARLVEVLPQRVDVAFRLSRNMYQGRGTLQLRVEDLRVAR